MPACKGTKPARTDAARLGDALAVGSGSAAVIDMVGVRGETLRVWGELRLDPPVPGVTVQRFVAGPLNVTRASTAMYGASAGVGTYFDVLRPAGEGRPYTAVAIGRDVAPGAYSGTLHTLDGRDLPATLAIAPVTLSDKDMPIVWAYYDPRELAWANLGHGSIATPSPEERACIATFRTYGVLLSPDIPVDAWPARKDLLANEPYIPAWIGSGEDARRWIEATRDLMPPQRPFAIPIDEPRDAAAYERVRKLAADVRAAGGGPTSFLFAVTDEPRPDYGDLIDVYISLTPKRGDTYTRWSYNGAPPRAGSMVLDTAVPPGPRTWGWIQQVYEIPLWYVWDALYWHDRHNRKGGPLPGRALDLAHDATSFDGGEDHGNLDGVLAFPGDATTPCLPSVRLAAIHRGAQDHALIAAALRCDQHALSLVRRMTPSALGDVAKDARPSWPTDEAAWERARRELIEIAKRCPN